MNAPDRAVFHAERMTGLGASDIAAVLGYSPYCSPVEMYMKKTGRMADDSDSMRLRFGQHNEEFVAKEYERVTGFRVQRFNPMLRHPKYKNIIGHVDRLVIPVGAKVAAHKGEIRTDRGLEAKTVDSFVYRTSGEWGEPGTDQVPTGYLIQTTTYMGLTGCRRWDLAALVGSGSGDSALPIYHMVRDHDLEEEIFSRAQEWWDTHVAKDVAPEPRSEDDVALLYPQAKQKESIESDDEIAKAVRELKNVKEAMTRLEEHESELSLQIKRFMGHADTLLGPDGKKLATWGNRKGRMTFDLDAFVGHLCPGANPAERSLFIEDAKRTFTTRGEPGRTFTLK
jgi:putative phage-type endonuclease